MCFDNAGIPIISYQDNGDSIVGFENKPEIRVISYSGNNLIKTGWNGEAPCLFNLSLLNNFKNILNKYL